jgi:hypothetical protein
LQQLLLELVPPPLMLSMPLLRLILVLEELEVLELEPMKPIELLPLRVLMEPKPMELEALAVEPKLELMVPLIELELLMELLMELLLLLCVLTERRSSRPPPLTLPLHHHLLHLLPHHLLLWHLLLRPLLRRRLKKRDLQTAPRLPRTISVDHWSQPPPALVAYRGCRCKAARVDSRSTILPSSSSALQLQEGEGVPTRRNPHLL